MARNELMANVDLANAYGAFCDERARWAQVLGDARPARRNVKPRGFVARIVAAFFA